MTNQIKDKQNQEIAELIIRENLTWTQIAEKIGIDRRTLYNRRQDPVFQQLILRRIGELEIQLEDMVETLWTSGNAPNMRQAAILKDKIVKRSLDKILPDLKHSHNTTEDITERQHTNQIWLTLLREAPQHIRDYINTKYTEINQRPQHNPQ